MPSTGLKNAHAVVTGGSRGIGAVTALRLARAGATVSLMGRDVNALEGRAGAIEKETGVAVHTYAADVTDADAVERAFAGAVDEAGDVTVLINNAGAVETEPFERTGDDMWRRMLDVNLTAVYHCCKQVVGPMRAAGRGRIVTVASTAGLEGAPYVSAYTAAKHGVIGLTRALASELSGTGVTANAVCPGYTDTDLVAESARITSEKTGKPVDEIRAAFARANPSGQLVNPDEVALAILWLIEGDLNGESVRVDGSDPNPPWRKV